MGTTAVADENKIVRKADGVGASTHARTEFAQGASSFAVFAAVAAFEFRMATRSRWTTAASVAFLVVALAISYFGLFGAGYVEFQGFERTATSLLSLVIYVAPLLGLMLGLDVFTTRGGRDLLFSEPACRPAIVLGMLAGLTATVSAALLLGLGGAGLMIAAQTGADGIEGYVVLVAASIALAATFAGIVAVAAFTFGDRLQASGAAAGAWLWFVLLYELVVLGVLFLLPQTSVRPLLLLTIFGSPVSLARVATLVALDAQPVLGAGGALMIRTFGSVGTEVALVAGLAAWVILTWSVAAIAARRRDAAE